LGKYFFYIKEEAVPLGMPERLARYLDFLPSPMINTATGRSDVNEYRAQRQPMIHRIMLIPFNRQLTFRRVETHD
jgi:hypothetical protein